MSLSQSITNYTNDLEKFEFSGCPEDFKTAFQSHITAWREMKMVTDKHPNLRGELHQIFEMLEKSQDSSQFKTYLEQILETWKSVEENSLK